MDNTDYNKMSKQELINLLKESIGKGVFCENDKQSLDNLIEYLNKIRAFTYNDRMKLAIIDEARFTIFAYDIDCKVVFWSQKCEEIYGHKKEFIIGKDYVSPEIGMVHQHERRKAYIDNRDIIENGTPFKNIANDTDSSGVTHTIQTNCFRINDVDSPNMVLTAEIGVPTNSIEDEIRKTNEAREQSEKIENLLTTMVLNLQNEIKQKMQCVTPKNKIKLQDISNELSKLILEHNEFEKKCNKWGQYVIHANNLDNNINGIKNKLNRIKNKSAKSMKNEKNPHVSINGHHINVQIGNNNNNQNDYKEQNLKNELLSKGIKSEQADELIKILREEKPDTQNKTLGKKAIEWCNNIGKDIKNIGIGVLSNLIFNIMYPK